MSRVVIVGGGSAGCAAAVAAARAGAEVQVIERWSFLGGTGAAVLDTFYGFYTPGATSRKIVGGIPDEVVGFMADRDAVIERPNTYGAGTGITYDAELLKVAWDTLLAEAGVRVLLNSFVVDARTEDGRVVAVTVANKAGLHEVEADVFVDASGDADVLARAGGAFEEIGSLAPVQSLTTTFRVGNVDVQRARAVPKEELWAMMREANASGRFALPREEGSVHITPHDGFMVTNMARVVVEDPTDPVGLSAAEAEGRRQALEYARFLRECVPGYERSLLVNFSTFIGVRETRRIHGAYRLTRDDVLSARRFPDEIALCGAPIEEHHAGADTRWEYVADGGVYGVPYRCLVPEKLEGLLVAGRCLSATHDAHASVRSIGQCMATGQAAGTAAAMAAASGMALRGVETARLRGALQELGAVLDEDRREVKA
jgi:2-polyprenyl-6-methoxyphenol hydroxylase-like FAD-dependent oxidoreductase